MTGQINDFFRYEGIKYVLAGISEGELLDPSGLGLGPSNASTACYRGYQAIYGLSGPHLFLHDLYVSLTQGDEGFTSEEGPPINGVHPWMMIHDPWGDDEMGLFIKGVLRMRRPIPEHIFNNHYVGIDYPLDYTGGLLLGTVSPRIQVHMGFVPWWMYKTVIELVFAKGIIRERIDRSQEAAENRREKRQADNKG